MHIADETVFGKAENTSGKNDAGKNRLDLVSPNIIEGIGWIRTFGTNKYGSPDNWKTIDDPITRYKAAAMRHFEAYRKGEFYDKESGYPHLWHVACNIMFLIDLEDMKPKDTRTDESGMGTGYIEPEMKHNEPKSCLGKWCMDCKYSNTSLEEDPCKSCKNKCNFVGNHLCVTF